MQVAKVKTAIGALVLMSAVGSLMATMSACSSQPESAQTAAANQIAMKFDLGQCQQLEPSLFKCPAVDKPLCDPGYNKNDVICVKVDKTGVLMQQLQ